MDAAIAKAALSVPRRGLDRAARGRGGGAIADGEGLDAVTLARVAAEARRAAAVALQPRRGRDGPAAGIALLGVARARRRDARRRGRPRGRRRARRRRRRLSRLRARAPRPLRGGDARTVGVRRGAHGAPRRRRSRRWRRCCARGRCHRTRSIHAVRAVRAALHGFVALEAAGGFGLPVDREASFDRLVAALAAGLRPAPARA